MRSGGPVGFGVLLDMDVCVQMLERYSSSCTSGTFFAYVVSPLQHSAEVFAWGCTHTQSVPKLSTTCCAHYANTFVEMFALAEILTSIPGCGVRHGAEPENTGA